ncbi:MAG: hypothetical protein K0R31_1564 [Clostridiales bacterium]|jgi:hypothetical protein|nr:hypothetical protein [Clostridiales bacterium]MDF2596764.1 hypothetical protein [Clostridia bacterium]MDF2791361.1 hypothetical protein [Neobacillus sp.]
MEQKLDYLKKYMMKKNGSVRLIPNDELYNIQSLPDSWYKVFREKNIQKRIQALLQILKKHMGVELRNTISYLEDYLENVEMMKVNNRYSILYTIKNRKNQIVYYEGRCPQTDVENDELRRNWESMPESIRTFYENVYN